MSHVDAVAQEGQPVLVVSELRYLSLAVLCLSSKVAFLFLDKPALNYYIFLCFLPF